MIDIQTHRNILLNLLKDFYQNPGLAPCLGFKGGTALYFFYDLPRFSIDLDFNLLVPVEKFQPEKIRNILEKYMTIKDYSKKHSTFFWLGSYQQTHRNVKVEISVRKHEDEYEILDLYGLSVKCLAKSYLFAHKLCAIHDRAVLTNRDLFDAHFMFQKQFPIEEKIIEQRTGMKTKDYFKLLIDYIPKRISSQGILQSLGDLLTPEKKQWAKEHLLEELLFYLKSYR